MPRKWRSKRRKTFPTFFLPVGEDIKAMFLAYVRHLRETLLFGDDDPLFPATKQLGKSFEVKGLGRTHWQTLDAIRGIFRRAFEAAGVPYYSPHTMRTTLVRLGSELCQTPEEFKAWSQNIGHDDVLTTFMGYGSVPALRQAELIKKLRGKPEADPLQDLMERMERLEQKKDEEDHWRADFAEPSVFGGDANTQQLTLSF